MVELVRTTALKLYRSPNTYAVTGTSRFASQFIDAPVNGFGNNYSNANWLNWAMAMLRKQNKPMQLLGNFAIAGNRTDQFNIASITALNPLPAFAFLDGPINDFSQQYPAAGTTVATALANQKAQIKTLNDLGIVVFYVWERGAQNYTSTMIGNLNDFNALMGDYLQRGDDARGPPSVVVLNPVPYTMVTSSNGTLAMKDSLDGTHDDVAQSIVLATAFSAQIAPYLKTYPNHRLDTLCTGASGLGSRGLIQSAGLTGSVAVAGTGNSGVVATNMFTGSMVGGITGVHSLQATSADADGNTWGQEHKVVLSSPGIGNFNYGFSLFRTNITAGDFLRAGVEIDVTAGATGLQNVSVSLEATPTTGIPTPTYDMAKSTIGLDVGGWSLPLEPLPLFVVPFTGSYFTNLYIRGNFNASGAATIICRKPWGYRATS